MDIASAPGPVGRSAPRRGLGVRVIEPDNAGRLGDCFYRASGHSLTRRNERQIPSHSLCSRAKICLFPSGKPKGRPKDRTRRRRRLRLKMRSTTIVDEEDSYTDRIGWNTSVGTVLEDNEEIVEEPKTITHQCSMCGSMMTVPKPKRERYRIVCTYPQCGHSDTVGI